MSDIGREAALSHRTGDLARARSLLFVPGSDRGKVIKAFASEADAVVADLEDTVATHEKDTARALVAEVLSSVDTKAARLVRVNAMSTAWAEKDLAMVAALDLDAIVVPKATPDAVAGLSEYGFPVVAIIETAHGVQSSAETAAPPWVVALALGGVDLGSQLRLEQRADGQEIAYVRSKLVIDSAGAGIRSPFDRVHVAVQDLEGLEAECRLARSLGFAGKACIHPAQVPVVNRIFAPSKEDVHWAERVISAYEAAVDQGHGATVYDGQMIDRPVVHRARKILDDVRGGFDDF